MLKTLIKDEHKDQQRTLGIVSSDKGGVQIQIEQDGQDAYIDLQKEEVRYLIGELDNMID